LRLAPFFMPRNILDLIFPIIYLVC